MLGAFSLDSYKGVIFAEDFNLFLTQVKSIQKNPNS